MLARRLAQCSAKALPSTSFVIHDYLIIVTLHYNGDGFCQLIEEVDNIDVTVVYPNRSWYGSRPGLHDNLAVNRF